jgi:hypothetical protein
MSVKFGNSLRMFESRVLRRMFASKRKEVKGKIVPVLNSAQRHEDIWGVEV